MAIDTILILDFGSQYTQLIARRVRELQVYCEIHPYNLPIDKIRALEPAGVILSGGPADTYGADALRCDTAVFALGVPVLGICYGMQLFAEMFGGAVAPSERREYGRARIRIDSAATLFADIGPEFVDEEGRIQVWMSHGNEVAKLPEGFENIGSTDAVPNAAVAHEARGLYGLQFHPEVAHTPAGLRILENYLYGICKVENRWTMHSFLDKTIAEIREWVGDKTVICGLSGGVDSSVAAMIVHQAIGDQLQCISVDNGLLREGEAESIDHMFRDRFHFRLKIVDSSKLFLDRLAEVTDPEQKSTLR